MSATAASAAFSSCRDRWFQLCALTAISDESVPTVTWEALSRCYTEPQRHYHTLEHVAAMLEQAAQHAALVHNRAVVELSIYFHDVIYDPKSGTNEEDSIVFFHKMLGAHVDPSVAAAVEACILATKTHKLPSSQDTSTTSEEDMKLFLDLDMEVLSRPRALYAIYAAQIRKEYIHVPEDVYCQRRAAFLQQTLDSSTSIYWSALFSTKEALARENLEWERQQLLEGVIPI